MSRVLPILFNTEMVRAILDGKKTVTRRVVKFPVNKFTNKIPDADNVSVYSNTLRSKKVSFREEPFYSLEVKPPYQPGCIMYVRETFCPNYFDESIAGCRSDGLRGNRNAYKADYNKDVVGDVVPEPKWKPSIHMPKEAARIWLKVTNVKVERLQDITEEQAQAEGCNSGMLTGPCSARWQFEELWNSTLKKSDLDRYGWDANPWVWVIEFERCKKPEEYA